MKNRPEMRAARLLGKWHLHPIRRRATHDDRRRTAGWGWRDNIVGVGVASKRSDGRDCREPSVTVYVKRKLPRKRLLRIERIPSTLALDANGGKRVLTDVVETGEAILHSDVVDPLQPGASLGHWRGLSGTLGIFVKKGGGQQRLLLSCSHVLALSGRGKPADPIEQPLVLDEDPDRVVARLTTDFTVLDDTAINIEDFALARVDVNSNLVPIGLTQKPTIVSSHTTDDFEPGTPTLLLGAETSGAEGRVRGGTSTWVLGGFTFSGLVPYITRCKAGDSGAAVVSADGSTLFGFHIGGSSKKQLGLFFPAGPLFARHNLTLA